MTDTSVEESSDQAGIERESLPGTFEHIRSLLETQVAADWGKLYFSGQVSQGRASCDCSYSLRGSDERIALQPLNLAELDAAVLELQQRLKEELKRSCQGIHLEYDADKLYTVQVKLS